MPLSTLLNWHQERTQQSLQNSRHHFPAGQFTHQTRPHTRGISVDEGSLRMSLRHTFQEKVPHQAGVRPTSLESEGVLQTEIRIVKCSGTPSPDRHKWVKHRNDSGQSRATIDGGVLCSCAQKREQLGNESHARVVMENEFTIQAFRCLVPAAQRHVARCHEEQVKLLFSGGDLRADLVDILKQRYVGLEKTCLRGRVDALHGSDGCIRGGLAAPDEKYLGRDSVAGKGQGCR